MADIFVSYKKEDAGRVVRIVEGLREAGFTVWWDHGIAPGSQWDQTIQKELNDSKMVIAVWSELSISAPWVKEEAGVGKARGKLLPVRIDDVNPPLGFGLIQMANLIDWDGDLDDEHWEHFLAAVKATLSGEPIKGLERPVKRKSGFLKMLPIIALVAFLAAVGVFVFNKLDSIIGISVDYDDGNTSAYNRGAAPPNVAEQAMFDKAQESTLKADYLDYLKVYSQGAFAKQIREEILPFCSYEQKDKWITQKAGQVLRGTSSDGYFEDDPDNPNQTFFNREDACKRSQENFDVYVDRLCKRFASNPDTTRNPVVSVIHAEKCDCQKNVDNTWFCFTDSNYSCSWETKSFENIEVCK